MLLDPILILYNLSILDWVKSLNGSKIFNLSEILFVSYEWAVEVYLAVQYTPPLLPLSYDYSSFSPLERELS